MNTDSVLSVIASTSFKVIVFPFASVLLVSISKWATEVSAKGRDEALNFKELATFGPDLTVGSTFTLISESIERISERGESNLLSAIILIMVAFVFVNFVWFSAFISGRVGYDQNKRITNAAVITQNCMGVFLMFVTYKLLVIFK